MKIPVCIRSEYVIIGIPPFFRLEGSAPPKRVSRPALWFSCLTFYHRASFSSICILNFPFLFPQVDNYTLSGFQCPFYDSCSLFPAVESTSRRTTRERDTPGSRPLITNLIRGKQHSLVLSDEKSFAASIRHTGWVTGTAENSALCQNLSVKVTLFIILRQFSEITQTVCIQS